MASNPIARSRIATFTELGEEEVFARYLELGSVRALMANLFEPRGGESIGSGAFYAWLDDEPERRARWQEILRTQGALDADEALEVARSATPQDAHAKRLLVDTLKWRASKLSPTYSDRKQVDVAVAVSTPQQWLEAMMQPYEVPPDPLAQVASSDRDETDG